jgi:hypothetical protein
VTGTAGAEHRRAPAPLPARPGRFAAAAAVAGLVAAAGVAGERPGLGVTVVAVALAGAALAAGRGPRDRWSAAWGVLALALAATPALRDAGWVVAPAALRVTPSAADGWGGWNRARARAR